MWNVSYRKAEVDGFNTFYREAGPKYAETLLLLHGFPSAGHMFRDLIPQLADRYHIIDVRFFDTGHFALETHCGDIAAAIRDFFDHCS